MQTDRGDVGQRFREILIPVPNSKKIANKYAAPYLGYFHNLSKLKILLREQLERDGFKHHIFFA